MEWFTLYRDVDPSGVSGVGAVAVAAVAPNGLCCITWAGKVRSLTLYHSLDDLKTIHCHAGMSHLDPLEQPPPGMAEFMVATLRQFSTFMGHYLGDGNVTL